MVANSGIGSFMLTDASESASDLSILPGIVTNIQGDKKFRNLFKADGETILSKKINETSTQSLWGKNRNVSRFQYLAGKTKKN